MNILSEFLDMIAEGIDPSTGEVLDIEALKKDSDFLNSVKKLNRTYREARTSSKYKKYEELYPQHVIVMKEGFFYSAHNDSASVLNYVLDYKLAEDYRGRISTGGPDAEKIAGALKDNDFSFIIVESGKITEEYAGRNAFSFLNISNAQAPANTTASNEKPRAELAFPYNLLSEILENTENLPEDVAARLDAALNTITSNGGRDLDILLFRYRDNETLEIIADRYSLSRQRICQLIARCLRKLRRQAVVDYLTDKRSELSVSKPSADKRRKSPGNILKLRSDQVSQVEISRDLCISISELARRITATRDADQEGSVKYIHIANWLVANGDLIEEKCESDNMLRRPTPQGLLKGFSVERHEGKYGEYTTVVLDENAQKYVLGSLDSIISYHMHKTDS